MALINVPNAGQTLGNSRPSINSNFAVIDTAFQVDHEDYNTTNQGMHNRVSFPTQGSTPTPMAGIVQLYSQLSSITNQPELVFAHQAGSTAPNSAKIVEFTSAGWANPGWTRLPSGILLTWHTSINMASMASVTLNLNGDIAGAPNFTNVFSVFTTTTTSTSYNTIVDIQSLGSTTPFTLVIAINGAVRPPSGFTVGYLAIGI